ncbi:hypothetical protein F4778DRAFT_755982 [Xylariomycetidae sp. FL2044]|nr:hypothetical protein F4778DRAFT_755982 [Xylariomycetidae sp. FL2044]
MESAPLVKAHDHAKAASAATHTADTTVAINEHTRAAGEFANAAKATTSVEALRTLTLLEQHHRRLSELLQVPVRHPTSQASSENDSQPEEKENAGPVSSPNLDPAASESTSAPSSEKNPQPMPTLTKQPRYPSRDLGASIASNLASARGIRSKYRSQPLSPSVSNTEAPGNMEAASRKSGSRTKMQNMLDSSDKTGTVVSPEKGSAMISQETLLTKAAAEGNANSSDEGFSRFYNAFGSIINRISAPLAFAGLPLINEEQTEEPTSVATTESPIQKRFKLKTPSTVSAEPDLHKLFSKAALRAIHRDGQSTNDSFYVVPTSGHTASYASILTFADKEKRRLEASVHGESASQAEDLDDEDFVDARESQGAHSPVLRKRGGKGRTDKDVANMVEELYLENKHLKEMLDKLTKRLHAFESMSQDSRMRLAESMRLMRPSSPPSQGNRGSSNEEALAKKNQELEDKLLAVNQKLEVVEKDYGRARANLVRYREKWDQLKAGAKARRAGGAQGNSEAEEGSKSPSLAL